MSSNGKTIRILSANLWNGGADPEAFLDLVLAQAVDVVAVQEITPEQAEVLCTAMPHGILEPGRAQGGMGILLRAPAQMSQVEMPRPNAHLARLNPQHWPQLHEPLEVMNIHISAPHVFWPRIALFDRPGQVRALEAHFRASPAQHRVAVGDYNSTPLWPAYRRIKSHLTDAAVTVAARTGRSPERTWGPWHGSARLLRIDHGFVSGPTVEAFRVVEIPGSDHSAIVMDVASGTRGDVGEGEGRERGGETGGERGSERGGARG